MNESKKKHTPNSSPGVTPPLPGNKEVEPGKNKKLRLTDKEISEAIGDPLPKSKKHFAGKESITRKFTASSGKKNDKNLNVGKK